MNYKSPGVYIEEIPTLPASVAQVETAIPAFIGYTEKTAHNGKDLRHEAVAIRSLVEYEEIFGYGPNLEITNVEVDGTYTVVPPVTMETSSYLYDSLKLFFANGGGKCYIFSCGQYGAAPELQHFTDSLNKLKKEDEPTLIVFPDAIGLDTPADFYQLQKEALKQAADLGDRFVIMDLLESDWQGEEFRNSIGTSHLKYGSAYTPYLKSSFPKRVRYRDFYGTGFQKRGRERHRPKRTYG